MSWQDDPVQYTTVNGVVQATWGAGGKMAPGVYQYVQGGGGPGYTDPNGFGWVPVGGSTAGSSTPNVSTVTGVNPNETSYSLYGHVIPLSVFGIGRIGGEIIAGPWIANGKASFCISFGVPADPSGTRTLKEIAFDSEVVWTAAGGFAAEAFTYRFYGGTLTQAADPLETANFGANAVAYRPQILLWFENLPLANTKFGKIPYVAAVIEDASGDDVNLGEAFQRLAASPWVNLSAFETSGITDGLVHGGLIITDQTDFLSLIQQFARFYRSWDILQTDKLRIVDRGSVTNADIGLNRSRLTGDVSILRDEPNSVPRVLELSTIDPDQDYTIVPSRTSRPRDPVNVSASVATESVYLPMIMDSSTRMSTVTYAQYAEEVSRKKIHFTATMYGLELEPGDLVTISGLPTGFHDESYKVIETLHGTNYTVEVTAQSFMNCSLTLGDPYLQYVVLLMSFNGTNGSTSAPGMTDESPHLWGDAQVLGSGAVISTSQTKFGASSLSLDGASDIRFVSSQANLSLLQFGSNSFTVEGWIYPNSISGTQFIVGRWDGFLGLPTLSWVFYLSGSALALNLSTTGTDNIAVASGGTVALHTWQHVAVDYNGSKYRLYLNGVMVGSSTTPHTIFDPGLVAPPLSIGGNNDNTGFRFSGFIDELRLTNGVARYASDGGFTVPTSAYPRT